MTLHDIFPNKQDGTKKNQETSHADSYSLIQLTIIGKNNIFNLSLP